ncbi:hypothetical protein PVAP13_2KG483005 [Panicum virgatum]|uniref:F-box domain-containing protein n=1 Tax=Panicum virgatum TaxID=38727 RepID=A0A8T0WS78_PANVG|nr:hypothetical protein PVAP13_2KG483005 [Panicum virgatum]KAG2646039.1 hypothetical protein PVAP13_2KG483005 [Panicum virgatum]
MALPFSDDILAEILIRLPALEDLGRACASCPAFRRVITGRAFLRRVHALHQPSLLGFHTFSAQFHPVEPPHPTPPTSGSRSSPGRASGWSATPAAAASSSTATRVRVLHPTRLRYATPCSVATCYFAPSCCEGEESLAVAGAPESFRVIWMAQCRTKLVAFVFSSASRQWRAIASPSWRDLNPGVPPVAERSPLHWRSYAYGCFYWLFCSGFPYRSNLIVLDMGRMEFYRVTHPSGYMLEEFAMMELGESRRGMFMFSSRNFTASSVLQLFSSNRSNHGEGANEWVLENTVRLSLTYKFNMLGVADGKLLLQGTP